MLELQIRERLEQGVKDKVFPGAVVGVVTQSGERILVPVGHFAYENDSPIVEASTVYDVASITKSIPTGCLALKLIEEGKLKLDDKLVTYLPQYHNNYTNDVLIKHLLTYSVILNFPIPGFSIQTATPEEVRHNLLTTDLKYPPGEVAQYSNSPALLLGMVIEKITGTTIDKLTQEYFFEELDMKHSTFAPTLPESIPPTEVDDWRGVVQGFVHHETSFVLGKDHPCGCAGLFSNVPDLLAFLEVLLNEGEFRGEEFFSPEMVKQMHTNQLSVSDAFMGLGWELNEPRFMGKFAHPDMFGKTGFTGTVCVIDPNRDVAFVLLSNCTYPKRKSSREAINEVRRDISDIVFGTYDHR